MDLRLEVVVLPVTDAFGEGVTAAQPGGGGRLMQEIKQRLPGRV